MNENIASSYRFLRERGYSSHAAAGILGNLMQEVGPDLDPTKVHDGGTGFGLAGWRDPTPGRGRKTDLYNYAKQHGLDVRDRITQLKFLDHELRTKETGVFKRLQEAKSPSEAALAFISFERPAGWTPNNPRGGHGWTNRNANAVAVYSSLSGAAPVKLEDVSSTAPETGRIKLNDVVPNESYDEREERQAAHENEKDASGFWGAAAESAWDASPIKWAIQTFEPVNPDPDFRWDKNEKLLQDVTAGLPTEYLSQFEMATSETHARKIRERIDDQLDLNRRISAGGWGATAGAMIGEILEPVGLASSFAIPEMAGVAKLSRAKRILASGTSAAAANAALEMPRYLAKETASGTDVLWAAGAGMALGGAFGALRRNPVTAPEAERVERLGKTMMQATSDDAPLNAPAGSGGAMASPRMQTLHPEMSAWFDDAIDAPETALSFARFDSVGQLKSSQSPVSRSIGGKLGLDAVGNVDRTKAVDFGASEYQRHIHNGMWTRATKEYAPALKDYLKDKNTSWSTKGETEARFRQEISDYIRNEDPSRAAEFHPAVTRMGDKLRTLTRAYQELLVNPGKVSGRTLDAVPGFENLQPNPNYLMRQIDHAKVFAKIKLHGDAPIADAFAKGMVAKNPELPPEVARKMAAGYVKRLHELSSGLDMKADRAISGHDLESMKEMLEEFGTLSAKEVDDVLSIFAPKPKSDAGVSSRAKHRAMFDENFSLKLPVADKADPRSGTMVEFRLKDMFEDDAMSIFQNYSRQVSGLIGLHQVHVRNPLFTPDHIRPLKRANVEVREATNTTDILTEAGEINLSVKGRGITIDGASLKTTDMEAIRSLVETAVDFAAEKGLKISTSVRVSKELAEAIKSLAGDYKVSVSKNAMRDLGEYLERSDGKPVFTITGQWKAPSPEPEFLVKGLSKDADWNRMVERVTQSWDELAGAGKVAHADRLMGLEKDLQNLDYLRNQILGRTDKVDQTSFGKALRRLRDYNFLRLMNNVGLAQINEFAMVTSSVGLKASLSAMPAFKHLLRNARTGELDDALAREIEYITNYGTDWVRGSIRTVADDFDNPINGIKTGGRGERYDVGVEHLKRTVSAISGMAGINTALQRFAARAVYAKFAFMADGATSINYQRMAVMGIDKGMADRIFKQIRDHRTYIEGASGKLDLPRMNLEKWADKEAAAHFQMGVTRWAEYAVLAHDPGQMSRVMGTWFGKTVFQFRSFIMGAWARHLLHNIHMRDWQTAGTFLFTGFTGTLLHVAHSHLATLGRSDREEQLEKRLSWKSLLLNGWARSSYSSFLPTAIDTVGSLVGADPLFTRVSGQSMDAILGNPTIGLLNDAGAGIRGLTTSIWDDQNEVSQTDVRNVVKAFPFQNWIPFQALLSTMIRDLPEFDPKGTNRR